MTRAQEIAKEMRSQDIWNPELCEELCKEAGMLEAWEKECNGDTFEGTVLKAAEKLGVEIL